MDCTEKKRRKDRAIDAVVFTVLLAAVSAVSLQLFYMQTQGGVDTDMKAYILEMQGLDSGYSFPYPIFFKLAGLVHLFASPELSVAVALVLMNGLGMVVTKLAFNRLARESGGGTAFPWYSGVICSLLAVSLFFISMLYPPKGIYLARFGIRFRYLGVFTANPLHNATYMAARPFAILAFLWYGKLLDTYEEGVGKNGKDYLLFALFLFLATMTKPSFTLVLVSSAGLLMLYRLFRSGFKKFVPAIQLGLCFIPTFLALLYQYTGVFGPAEGEERGIGFCFGSVWKEYCDNIPLGICLAMAFPLAVLVLNWKEVRRNTLTRFSWMLYLVSLAEAFLFYEKGFRRLDFNFSWGYMYGIFFCHFSSLLLLTRLTAENRKHAGQRQKVRSGLLLLQWLVYLWHVICGIFYFRDILAGISYY
ncbi:MAG: hypothetical protein NC123_07780 [Butyrivibrio sp.]|nr:hypothetical protein [Acetatifactor muris]MCM1559431.1 hypothetical protein [Butyrivibrio sp.]